MECSLWSIVLRKLLQRVKGGIVRVKMSHTTRTIFVANMEGTITL